MSPAEPAIDATEDADADIARSAGAGLAVVTGAAGALGGAVLGEFVARGVPVAALDLAGPRLDALAGTDGVYPVPVDLTDPDDVDAAWRRIDELGIAGPPLALVCVAGGFDGSSLADTGRDTLASMLEVNLATAVWCCRAAADRMRAAGGGAIVTIGSRTGVAGQPGGGPVAYAAAKAAVIRMTEVLAEELRPDRIRVNAVLPSVIDTPANRAWMSPEAVAAAVAPAAVAKVVTFLCSPDAAPVSGATVPVYGL